MVNNEELRLYNDTLIVETILSNKNKFLKKADVVSNLTESVKNYISAHIDPNDKAGSLLNILAPGALSITLSAMGLGWVGLLIGFAMRTFNIDVKGILSSIYDGIKSLIHGSDSKISSSQVDEIVNSTIQSHATEAIPVHYSMQQSLKDAKFLKLALINYDKNIISGNNIFKYAAKRGSTLNILGKVLGWIFKISLASAGFMVAGDAVNKLLDRPNAFDGTLKDGKSTTPTSIPVDHIAATQTKFPVKSDYVDTQYNVNGTNWIEKVNNSKSSIENMLVQFTKEVYDNVNDQEIKASPTFKTIVDNIAWYNHSAAGDPIVFIPKMFVSKKQLVDHFIDSVASSATNFNQNKSMPGTYTA